MLFRSQGYWALRTIVDIESPTIGGKHYLTVNKWGDPPIGFRIREEENEYDIGDDGLNCDNFCVTGIRPAIWVSLHQSFYVPAAAVHTSRAHRFLPAWLRAYVSNYGNRTLASEAVHG